MKKLSWGLKRFNVNSDAWQVEIMPWTAKNTSGNLKQKEVIGWAVVDQAADKKMI